MEFHQCHAKPHSICFLPQYQRWSLPRFVDGELKTPIRTWKCTRLYVSDFPVKYFCKLAQQYDKIFWEKSNDRYSLSIRVQTTLNDISLLRLYVVFLFLCFFFFLVFALKNYRFPFWCFTRVAGFLQISLWFSVFRIFLSNTVYGFSSFAKPEVINCSRSLQ